MLYPLINNVIDPLEFDFGDLHSSSACPKDFFYVNLCEEVDYDSLFKNKLKENVLYIVGNGFDIHHSLLTKYVHYRDFIKKYDENLYNYFIANFGFGEFKDNDILWNNFEEIIKYSITIPFNQNVTPSAESLNIESDNLINQISYISNHIDSSFYKWIESVEEKLTSNFPIDINLTNITTNNSLFITFNYTDLLEKYYNIPNENVFHIHGKYSKENQEKLFAGFCDVDFKILDNYYKIINDNSIDIPSKHPRLNNISDSSIKKLLSYFEKRNKVYYLEANKFYQFHTKILKLLKHFNKVVILGHSFGSSDAYSLKLIRDQMYDENIEWYIGVWKNENKDYIEKYVKMVMYKMLLTTEQTRYFLW